MTYRTDISGATAPEIIFIGGKIENMNEKQKQYILKNWKKYDIVDSEEEMVKLLNILEAHNENLDTFHMATSGFCGIYGEFLHDRDTAQTLFNFNCFYNNEEEMRKNCAEYVEGEDMTLDEFLEGEDIRKTSDGIVRVLYY